MPSTIGFIITDNKKPLCIQSLFKGNNKSGLSRLIIRNEHAMNRNTKAKLIAGLNQQ